MRLMEKRDVTTLSKRSALVQEAIAFMHNSGLTVSLKCMSTSVRLFQNVRDDI